MQIIYCTHSPHLVDVNKLYRILAVQRADESRAGLAALVDHLKLQELNNYFEHVHILYILFFPIY